jgi:thiamine-phosphate diphosphorylase
MRPVMCMVTAPARGAAATAALLRRVGAAARAGVHLIQVRDHEADGGSLTSLAAGCVSAVHGTAARVLVNDRLDVALAAGAHGVHLRADSVPAKRVRQVAPRQLIVGRSVHDAVEAEHAALAGGLDYLIFGTVFTSASKPGARAAGVEALAAVVRRTPLPVLAIGGLSPLTAPLAARAGAAGCAGIELFTDDDLDRLAAAIEATVQAFDSSVNRSNMRRE